MKGETELKNYFAQIIRLYEYAIHVNAYKEYRDAFDIVSLLSKKVQKTIIKYKWKNKGNRECQIF